MQSPLAVLYPSLCVGCGEPVIDAHGLCGRCWSSMPFITGLVCEKCGVPLAGDEDEPASYLCDACMTHKRPWHSGRAAVLYAGDGRRTVLQIKLSDRLDLVPPAAEWMARAGRTFLTPDTIIVSIPAHWTRVFRRRYNQASELARGIAKTTGLEAATAALYRPSRTQKQYGKNFEGRFNNLEGKIQPHPKRGRILDGRHVVLVDDVMTSGATFSAATAACFAAGARRVDVLSLARATRDA